MQSQQKKVKWSRGETADALEERTDTGITQVSVSKLENIIADIYGNISRRPALKIISNDPDATDIPVVSWVGVDGTNFVRPPQSFVFTIDENTYIIFIKDTLTNNFGGLLINNNKFVKRVKITNLTNFGPSSNNPVSAAQYNNYMVVSNLYTGDVVLRLTDTNDIIVEKYQFSAPWYAPEGTQTKTVSNDDLAGLQFNADGLGFTAWAWTDDTGNSSPYSIIDTGLNGSTTAIAEAIPVGSIVKFPNLGAYMRVEGYTQGGHTIYFGDWTFDSVTTEGNISTTGWCCDATILTAGGRTIAKAEVRAYYNGVRQGSKITVKKGRTFWVQSTASLTGYKQLTITEGAFGVFSVSWSDVTPGSLDVKMFGALLTPVADGSAKDTVVTVEYGYISLETYQPTKFAFSNQRLYAAGFYDVNNANTQRYIPGYTVGSQIAKYNDFKNDYNTQSEAVVIDISTAYQEKIVSIIDYNGLKIMTDCAEYAYMNGGVVKQSENGSLETCNPIVFGSVCLYADKSSHQIRALEYEFSSNLFQSSSINQMTKEDLIFNTTSMAGVIDKEYYTGRFLYAPQNGYTRTPDLRVGNPVATHSMAVCNMVPGNQALIWSRWNAPEIVTELGYNRHTIQNVIEVNNKIWFVMACYEKLNGFTYPGYTLAELDHNSVMDIEINPETTATEYIITKNNVTQNLYAWGDVNNPGVYVYTNSQTPAHGDPIYTVIAGTEHITSNIVDSVVGDTLTYGLPGLLNQTATYDASENILKKSATLIGATVSVFDGDEYKWDDTLTATGEYTKPLTDLANPRVGFMINATLESHPIDVGGKTYTDKKRIGKAVAVIRNTEPGTFTVCGRTGYTSPDKKTVSFYGCTGMKDQVRYTINNIQGAKFTIESLTMIIEYGTLES